MEIHCLRVPHTLYLDLQGILGLHGGLGNHQVQQVPVGTSNMTHVNNVVEDDLQHVPWVRQVQLGQEHQVGPIRR